MIITALTSARMDVMTAFSEATGHIEGQNSFSRELPDITNAWSFMISGGDATQPRLGCYGKMRWDCQVLGRYQELEMAEQTCMQILDKLNETDNLSSTGTLFNVRPLTMPTFEVQDLTLDGDTVESSHILLTMPMDMIVITT